MMLLDTIEKFNNKTALRVEVVKDALKDMAKDFLVE
jgi:hypothetical protein